MRVYCDECGHEFDFGCVKVKSKWIDKGMQKKYYNCPKCNHEFIIVITNAEIRRISREYKALRDKYNNLTSKINKANCEAANAILNNMVNLLDNMNNNGDELRKQYESNL